jgi:hypothetical protein
VRCNYVSVSMVRIISVILGGLGELVGPSVDNRMSVDIADTGPQATMLAFNPE